MMVIQQSSKTGLGFVLVVMVAWLLFLSQHTGCAKVSAIRYIVWNQQAQYLKHQEYIKVPDIHALFIRNLCKALGDMIDEG